MSEFSKILIAALTSFTLGIISEPIRAIVMASVHAKPLRRSLYMELAALHRELQQCNERDVDVSFATDTHRLRHLSFDTYRNAKATKPEFYSLPDAVIFDELFGAFEYYVKTPPPGFEDHENVMRTARALLHFIDKYLKDGRLNDDIFRDVYPEYSDYLAKKEREHSKNVNSVPMSRSSAK